MGTGESHSGEARIESDGLVLSSWRAGRAVALNIRAPSSYFAPYMDDKRAERIRRPEIEHIITGFEWGNRW